MSHLNDEGSEERRMNDDNPAQSDHEDGSARRSQVAPIQTATASADATVQQLVDISLMEYAIEILKRTSSPRKRTRRPRTKRTQRNNLRLEPDPDKPLDVPQQDQACNVADEKMDVDSIPVEDRCGIYTLPATIPAPKEKNLRIASPVPRPSEEFFVASDDSKTVPMGHLLDAHKKRWKNVREKCVKAAMANEESLENKESLAILEDASQQRIKSAEPPQQARE